MDYPHQFGPPQAAPGSPHRPRQVALSIKLLVASVVVAVIGDLIGLIRTIVTSDGSDEALMALVVILIAIIAVLALYGLCFRLISRRNRAAGPATLSLGALSVILAALTTSETNATFLGIVYLLAALLWVASAIPLLSSGARAWFATQPAHPPTQQYGYQWQQPIPGQMSPPQGPTGPRQHPGYSPPSGDPKGQPTRPPTSGPPQEPNAPDSPR